MMRDYVFPQGETPRPAGGYYGLRPPPIQPTGRDAWNGKPLVIVGFCGVISLAIQHVRIKNGARGSGAKHARYVAGEGRYGDRDDVAHVEDGNLPKWAATAEEFFDAADKLERGDYTKKLKTNDGVDYEKLIKGRSYKEVEAAIPREAKDPVQWAKDYARDLLGDQHPYRLAVHDKAAGGGGRNIHMHLMFSTRTMDGHDRSKEGFFKRAASSYRDQRTKQLVQRDPASGGAAKSKYWNSRDSIGKTREKFKRHVQRVAPDFKMERSDAPEPKMGPALKNAGKEYNDQREQRMTDVSHLRSLKMVRGMIDSEIKLERERERPAEKARSKTDDLWAKMEARSAPKIEDKQQEKAPTKEQDNKAVDWTKYRSLAVSSSAKTDNKKNEKMNPMNDLQSGPGYFPETKADKEMREGEGVAFPQLEQQKRDQSEQQRDTERNTDDLWRQMEKERMEREQKDRDRDNDGPDFY